jgi:hypothetical protein
LEKQTLRLQAVLVNYIFYASEVAEALLGVKVTQTVQVQEAAEAALVGRTALLLLLAKL